MNKKVYISPEMLTITLQHKTGILELSGAKSQGLGQELQYNKSGDNQTTNAWGKSRGSIWDEQ